MNTSTCPECGAILKPGTTLCSACLLSAGSATMPLQPVSAGFATLPCVFGGYRLIKKLGAGGMGIVYEAEQIFNGRRLALKVLNQSLDNDEQRQRFLREGQLAATIDHPNSVYVFGTEEIDGVPVIAMELAAGGTLRDEVKCRGTLPVRAAVDAILGIIDGLEAAHAKGVLHRDMKPTNCFVTREGKAIVGDYGLSISQSQDAEHLTQSGVIMGTPAFSPPEQLRGQPLDQRADIYSTAGTLYYLLTGKAPVERASSVEVVAAVLEGKVPRARSLRSEVPEDLSSVIARCLSPDAAKRPASYGELRALLLPFSSTAAEPAPLGLRLLGGLIDGAIGAVLFYGVVLSHPTRWSLPPVVLATIWSLLPVLAAVTWMIARFGATPGLWLLGLRAQTLDGARPDGWRALRWNGDLMMASVVSTWLAVSIADVSKDMQPAWLWSVVILIVGQLQMLNFVASLRRVDRAASHDLRSGVRMVRHREAPQRMRALDALPQVLKSDVESWGPFSPGVVISPELRCGYDPVLRRRVLLRRMDSSTVSETRRDCARGGRLRYLQRVTADDGSLWDAWQAVAGAPLSSLLRDSSPNWSELLFWLQDVSAELDAAEKDNTRSTSLSLNHVWITSDGRAVLLDEPWPGLPSSDVLEDSQRFLHLMAAQVQAVERPIHADELVRGLESSSFERLSHVSGNLTHLRQKRASVSPLARAACVLGPMLAAAMAFAGICWIGNALYRTGWEIAMPGQPPLPDVMKLDSKPGDPFQTDAEVRRQMRIHIAGHYRDFEANQTLVQTLESHTQHELRQRLRRVISEEPAPSPEALAAADRAVHHAIETLPTRGIFGDANFKKAGAVLSLAAIMIVAIAQLLSALVGSPPLLMRLTGMALVTISRRPASRLQLLRRWLIGWCALWSVAVVIVIGFVFFDYDPIRKLPENAMLWVPVMLLLMFAGLLRPRRSLLDRLAGTWIVVR